MKIRIRIDAMNPQHAYLRFYDGRDHGPMLGVLVIATDHLDELVKVEDPAVGGTYAADLEILERVR